MRNYVLAIGPIVLFVAGIVLLFVNWVIGGFLLGMSVVVLLLGVTGDIANFGSESLERWRQDGKKYK